MMITLHFISSLTFLGALKVTIDDNPASLSIAIIALLISIIGPFAGSYMFIKNANKMFGMMAGGINKLGSPFRKLANQFAGDRFKNSKGALLFNKRRQNSEEFAQRKAYLAMSRRDAKGNPAGFWANAALAGTSGKQRSALEGQLYAAESKIYNQDVGYKMDEYKRLYDSKEAMQQHMMSELDAGRMDAASMKAALDHMASFSGGGTMIDNMVRGTDKRYGNQFWEGMKKHYTGGQQDAWKGASRALAGGAYADASPDTAGFIAHHGDAALFTSAETTAQIDENGNVVRDANGNAVQVSRIQDFSGPNNWTRTSTGTLTVSKDGKQVANVPVNQGLNEATPDGNMSYEYIAERLSTKAPALGKSQGAGLKKAILAGLNSTDKDTQRRMMNSVLAVSDQTLSTIKDPLIKDIVIEMQEKAKGMKLPAAGSTGSTG